MAGISEEIAYLDRIGWSELIDPRWTNDVRKDLRESGLGLTEDEIVEICRIVIYRMFNSEHFCPHKLSASPAPLALMNIHQVEAESPQT